MRLEKQCPGYIDKMLMFMLNINTRMERYNALLAKKNQKKLVHGIIRSDRFDFDSKLRLYERKKLKNNNGNIRL